MTRKSLSTERVLIVTAPMYLHEDVLPRIMNIPSMHWSSEFRQLLFIGVSVVTAAALSYDYVTTEGFLDMFFLIIGAGLLLAMLVIVPILLFDRRQGSA